MSEDIRGPDNKDLAEVDYCKGMKYKDIAEKYGVTINTVKSWKTRYKWSRNGVHTQKKVCTQKSGKKNTDKEPIGEEVKEVLENTKLTDNQRLFCIYYVRCFNATKAYQKAYGCSYETANVEGCKSLAKPSVKGEIQKLKQNKLNRALLNEDDIFQKYIDIAFSDIGDYLSFRTKRKKLWVKDDKGNDIPVIDPDTGEQKVIEFNTVELNNSKELDTSLLTEVSEGKDGVKIKLHDKMKALQWLSDRMDLLPIATKDKLELERNKLELLRLKAGDGEHEEIEDDGFLDALRGSVSEVWTDEDSE
ncbi:MAG: terminase small subunit [Clostridium sp.]